MATFTVWTLDVWGNENDGYEVNDRCKVGTVDIPDFDNATDHAVLVALVEAGYLKPGSEAHGSFDGSDGLYYVEDKNTACPWLQLETIDEEA